MMTNDLFVSQPVPQIPSTGIQSGKTGPSGLDRPSGNQHTQESQEGDNNNFLSTLKQVSQDQGSTKQPESAGQTQSSASADGGGIDEASGYEASVADVPVQTEPDSEPDQLASDWNFGAFIQLLENMGLYDAAGGSGLQNLADASPLENNQMDLIQSLIAGLQQNQFGPTVDPKVGLERLQQFITNALIPIDGTSGQGLSSNQLADLAQLNQLIKGMAPVIKDQTENSGLPTGQGTSGVKTSGAIAAEVGTGVETSVKSFAVSANPPETASLQTTENATVLSPTENRSEVDPKLTAESQPLVSNSDLDSKSALAAESADAAASKNKVPLDYGHAPRAANRTEAPGLVAATPEPDQRTATENMQDNQSVKPSASPGPDPSVVKKSESQIQSASGEEPLSKILQEVQLVKEGVVKVDSGSTEEAVSKVLKTDAGTNDNGLLNSSGHNMEKAADAAAIQKNTEAGQGDLRNQAMDQIVRKAAIFLRNGQHEARIELKPEFLGHIRMQVISDNHLVTVKILAQHGFVKDMIESNVHQLKADLQQQGLEIDKLEVSVSRDSEDSGNFKDKLAQSKARRNHAGRRNEDHSAQMNQKETAEPLRTPEGGATVDYFA